MRAQGSRDEDVHHAVSDDGDRRMCAAPLHQHRGSLCRPLPRRPEILDAPPTPPTRPATKPSHPREHTPRIRTEAEVRGKRAGDRCLLNESVRHRLHGRREQARGLERATEGTRDDGGCPTDELHKLCTGAAGCIEWSVVFGFAPFRKGAPWNRRSVITGGPAVARKKDRAHARRRTRNASQPSTNAGRNTTTAS
jgi:hypothetical protein